MNSKKIMIMMLSLFVTQTVFAVEYPGLDKNVVMSCGSGSKRIYIISDSYTTVGYRELEGNPGQMATVIAEKSYNSKTGLSLSFKSQPQPLSFVRATGWLDKILGIYENNQFILDLSSRNVNKINLKVKTTGEILNCSVEGDCC